VVSAGGVKLGKKRRTDLKKPVTTILNGKGGGRGRGSRENVTRAH